MPLNFALSSLGITFYKYQRKKIILFSRRNIILLHGESDEFSENALVKDMSDLIFNKREELKKY